MLDLAANCGDSDAKALVQAYAYDKRGDKRTVLGLLAPLLLESDSILTQQGFALVLKLLLRAAQQEDLEMFEVLNDRTAVQREPHARIVKSFYFGGIEHGECSLYRRVLEAQQQIKRRMETIRSVRPLAYRIEFLKHYSSYTPLMRVSDSSLGGGYFLLAGDFGCVIDPGYDFLSNFTVRHSIADIDAVVVTHCHDDHNADLPALLSLLYRRKPPRSVQLYLDRHTFDAHRHLIFSSDYVQKPCRPISTSFGGWPDNSPWITMAKKHLHAADPGGSPIDG